MKPRDGEYKVRLSLDNETSGVDGLQLSSTYAPNPDLACSTRLTTSRGQPILHNWPPQTSGPKPLPLHH